jgi:hypothetical protein
MRPFHKFDTDLGEKAWDKGYRHIRLVDQFIEHTGGGKRSQTDHPAQIDMAIARGYLEDSMFDTNRR